MEQATDVTVQQPVTILAIIVGLLILSMLLHGQMRIAKAGYVAMPRQLVADAYAPCGPLRTADRAGRQARARCRARPR